MSASSRILASGPLSLTQEQLWFLAGMDPESAFYNVPVVSRVRGLLDIDVLRNAVRGVVTSQAVLRTEIVAADGGAVQRVTDRTDIDIDVREVVDEKAAAALATELSSLPFDLATGPIRVSVLRWHPERAYLVVVLHHIACDGWSMEVLFSQLLGAIAAPDSGAEASTELAPPTYLEHSLRQRERLQGDHLDTLVGYWRNHLQNAPAEIALPHDFRRPETGRHDGDRVDCALDESVSERIIGIAKKWRSTPFIVLLTCFAISLSQQSGDADVVVGCPVANRNRREDDGVVGYYADTLALRCSVDASATFREVHDAVKAGVLGGFRHRELPFGMLVRSIAPPRSAANPLFQVMFALQNVPRRPRPEGDGGLSYEVLPDARPTAIFDLRLDLTQRDGRFLGFLEYSTAIFTRQRAEAMHAHWQAVVHDAVADPEGPIAALGNGGADDGGFSADLDEVWET
ncbi:condensation domain-containing protein [Microbacterium lacticum]|uniref:Condensation domain-containing protein n=1 Tax=Microbacterium lacticum TaxID=33885 RepID=A0A4Y3UN64_9MICO|nr:condensation domain-containing protein [Microbacterium lacticum]TQM90243.1 condensation domain-containing protein [Microbacterium lacticum]GEB95157.1 hypothetical protein MLA01_13760 [Microbacterium lacticum]GGN21865.1 hypothetical protein GCM10009724_15150 [Microbacterium lacticum]